MTSNKFRPNFIVILILMTVGVAAGAQQTVYKWTDEEGVVHFGDAPPDASETAEVETLTTSKAPTAPAEVWSSSSTPAPARPVNNAGAKPAQLPAPVFAEELDLTTMSLRDLDQRCEDAREIKIAPLQSAEIAKCQQDKQNDPAWCERFNADFGDAARTMSGTMRPRMFDDLPQCVDALRERNRRGL
jgi:hypothetical protein